MLVGEARLWYELLRPIVVDRNGLQAQLTQQYSKIGNTGEQLFYGRRSTHFDVNSKTIYNNITYIRQIAALLGYGAPHVLEVLKSTFFIKTIIGFFFSVENLR